MTTHVTARPETRPEDPVPPSGPAATFDRRGPGCPLARDLLDLARAEAEGRPTPAGPAAHVRGCAYCGPRFESQVGLHRAEPAAADPPAELRPPDDSWSGALVAAHALAAFAGRVDVAARLAPAAGGRLATRPVYLELQCEPARAGKVRCQVILPVTARGMADGTPREDLEKLGGNQFMVELSGDDWHGGCGFGVVLQWDPGRTALVSAHHLLPADAVRESRELVLTHLQAVPDHDLA